MLETLALGAAAHDPPLIDLDFTIALQLVIFLIATVCLKKFLFGPFLRVRQAREESTTGARDNARQMTEQTHGLIAEFETGLAKARLQAGENRQKLQLEATGEERRIETLARQDAQRLVGEARLKFQRD